MVNASEMNAFDCLKLNTPECCKLNAYECLKQNAPERWELIPLNGKLIATERGNGKHSTVETERSWTLKTEHL